MQSTPCYNSDGHATGGNKDGVVFLSSNRITHNDRVPEMLAVIRRGPFAEPTESEKVEYLLTRVKKKDRVRTDFENYALEHVLSYQRRVSATKESFMKRNTLTPLGIMTDWWDRTEAQMRAALHAHILCWFRLRKKPENYMPGFREAHGAWFRTAATAVVPNCRAPQRKATRPRLSPSARCESHRRDGPAGCRRR